MSYVKHNYSNRIYQVMTDHGPEATYLWSPWDFAKRYPKPILMERFFSPCEKPAEMPRSYPISIPQEIEWEKRELAKNPPKVAAQPQKPANPFIPSKLPKAYKQPTEEGYTLKDLCQELSIEPATARKLLRSKGKSAPDGGWKWPDAEAAKPIKKFLKKLL